MNKKEVMINKVKKIIKTEGMVEARLRLKEIQANFNILLKPMNMLEIVSDEGALQVLTPSTYFYNKESLMRLFGCVRD